MSGKPTVYEGLSFKEKVPLWREYDKIVNPRPKLWYWFSVFTYVMAIAGAVLVNIHLQGSIWFNAGNPTLWYVGWALFPLGFVVALINIKQETERRKKFFIWLKAEKDISRKNKK